MFINCNIDTFNYIVSNHYCEIAYFRTRKEAVQWIGDCFLTYSIRKV